MLLDISPLVFFTTSPCLIVTILFILYRLGVVTYRLIWHPLAGFPGPKLAGASSLYGAYYDLIDGRSLCRQVAELHKIYGPIVRISPDEVHINDIESYNRIFRVGTNFHKVWDFYNSKAIEGSLLNILDTPTAKKRRDAYSRYFSREAVTNLEPRIKARIGHLVSLLQSSSASQSTVNLSFAFRCLTADVIIDYAYREDFGGLSSPGFKHPLITVGDTMLVYAQWGLYFRKAFMTLDTLVNMLPDRFLDVLSPAALGMRNFQTACARSIQNLKKTRMSPSSKANSSAPNHMSHAGSPSSTIFDTILDPSSNKGRPTPDDGVLTSEACLMLLAGTDTTANTLVVATYAMLRNQRIADSLMAELFEVMPTSESVKGITAEKLRSLPYLNACVKEALRLSYGAPGRLPRIVPRGGTKVGDIDIPAGVIVSHSNYVYHMDEEVFPHADRFEPERWLTDDTRKQERRLLPFAKGSRACLGINLAFAELLLTMALLFRTTKMTLNGTDDSDMQWRDYSVALFNGHLNVLVEGSIRN